jgi:uncharacterized membrane protein YdjX (TVP38/TMEM64 family)
MTPAVLHRRRPWLLPLAAGGFFVAIWVAALAAGVDFSSAVDEISGGDRSRAGLLIVLLLTADVVAPVPNIPVIVLAGTLFDIALGTSLVVLGSMAASTAAYLLGRFLPERLLRRLANTEQLQATREWSQGSGRWVMVASRAIPLLAESIGLAAGASRSPFVPFFGWTLLGTVPVCLALVTAGSMVETAESALLTIALLALAVWGAGRLLQRRTAQPQQSSPQQSSP